jgi:hypothetical protein
MVEIVLKILLPYTPFCPRGDIAKAGVSNILGTPWVAYEKLKAVISRNPVTNARWITRGCIGFDRPLPSFEMVNRSG